MKEANRWHVSTNLGLQSFASLHGLIETLKLGLRADIEDIVIWRGDAPDLLRAVRQSRRPENLSDKLSRVYEAKTGTGESLGFFHAIAYCEAPTFDLEGIDGNKVFSWREDYCRIATDAETAAFWRKRAEHLQSRLEAAAIV